MLEFAFPWVFALLPLPLLVRWIKPYRRYVPHVRAPIYDQLAKAPDHRPRTAAWVHRRTPFQAGLLGLTWCLMLFVLAKPLWLDTPLAIEQSRRDVLVLIDISGSMGETDEGGITRLARLKDALNDFSTRRGSDRLGLIVFADKPYLQAPMTADAEAWRTLLAATRLGPAGRNTAIGDAMGLGLKHLADTQAEEKVLLLVTDGSDNRSLVPPREAALVASQRGVRVFTVAIGDDSATSEVDVETLRAIADLTRGEFYDARQASAMASLSDDFAAAVPVEEHVEWYYPSRDLYAYPLLLIYGVTLATALFSLFRQRREGRL
ncbi:MAG: hypothetical protein RL336_1681 [Pseudomonadota bacterium]|jgi:Ca-activated chloride channel family protein